MNHKNPFSNIRVPLPNKPPKVIVDNKTLSKTKRDKVDFVDDANEYDEEMSMYTPKDDDKLIWDEYRKESYYSLGSIDALIKNAEVRPFMVDNFINQEIDFIVSGSGEQQIIQDQLVDEFIKIVVDDQLQLRIDETITKEEVINDIKSMFLKKQLIDNFPVKFKERISGQVGDTKTMLLRNYQLFINQYNNELNEIDFGAKITKFVSESFQ